MPKFNYLSPALQSEDAALMQSASLSGIEAKIHVDLWNAIIDRKLKPGVKLEELVMCDIYGISRTVMRKVLMIMEQDGLVFLPPNKGAYVASPSLQSAFEMCQRRSKNRPRGGAKVGHCGAGLRPPGGRSPSGGLKPARRFFVGAFQPVFLARLWARR